MSFGVILVLFSVFCILVPFQFSASMYINFHLRRSSSQNLSNAGEAADKGIPRAGGPGEGEIHPIQLPEPDRDRSVPLSTCSLDLVLNAPPGGPEHNTAICVVSRIPGHSLGMDIHDSVTLPKDKPLEPGVVSSRSVPPSRLPPPSYPSNSVSCVHFRRFCPESSYNNLAGLSEYQAVCL